MRTCASAASAARASTSRGKEIRLSMKSGSRFQTREPVRRETTCRARTVQSIDCLGSISKDIKAAISKQMAMIWARLLPETVTVPRRKQAQWREPVIRRSGLSGSSPVDGRSWKAKTVRRRPAETANLSKRIKTSTLFSFTVWTKRAWMWWTWWISWHSAEIPTRKCTRESRCTST